MSETLIPVRATIHVGGLHPGEVVWVDPENDYIRACLEAGFLVEVARDDEFD